MKKIMTLLIVAMCTFGSVNVNASNIHEKADYTFLEMEDKDASAILQNEKAILRDINAVLSAENHQDKLVSELNWDQCVKIYSDTDIMTLNTTNEADIKDNLSAGNYIYVCYFELEDICVRVILNVGREVNPNVSFTEEERNELEKNVGKWKVSSIGILESGDKTYQDILENTDLSNYDDVLIANSQAGFGSPIAIGMDDGKAEDIILLEDSVVYNILDDEKITNTYRLQNNVYSFEEMAQIARENYVSYEKCDEGNIGGNGTVYIEPKNSRKMFWLPIASACILIVIACILFKKKRNLFSN